MLTYLNEIPLYHGIRKKSSQNQKQQLNSKHKMSSIAETFKDKSILLTGASGFLAKVFLEKLLRCTEISKIYLFTDADSSDIFKEPLFDVLRSEKSDVFSKINPIRIDLDRLQIGLSETDRSTIIDEVEIIYNTAENVDFHEDIRSSVLTNVKLTNEVVEIAKECKKLEFLCHISSIFVHPNVVRIGEDLYESVMNLKNVLSKIALVSSKIINSHRKEIIDNYTNNYEFTKSLGESIIKQEFNNLPVAVIRTSLLLPIWKEPLPGWVDNVNSPSGFFLDIGLGLVRILQCNKHGSLNHIPVDIAVNNIFQITFNFLNSDDENKQRVFNVVASENNQITVDAALNIASKYMGSTLPTKNAFMYPEIWFTKSRIVCYVVFLLFQLLPAIFGDLFYCLSGRKTFLVKKQMRIWKNREVVQYFLTPRPCVESVNYLKADFSDPEENSIYKSDCVGLDYHEYIRDCVCGIRKFLLKTNEDSLHRDIEHIRRIRDWTKWYDLSVIAILICMAVWFASALPLQSLILLLSAAYVFRRVYGIFNV